MLFRDIVEISVDAHDHGFPLNHDPGPGLFSSPPKPPLHPDNRPPPDDLVQGMPPPRPMDKNHINDRISLFDASKMPVAGVSRNVKENILKEILLNGQGIGYLGVIKNKPPSKPHELRTPLSILQGEIEALQDGVRPLDDKALQSLHSEVSHINTIVDDLYSLSLADCGGLSFNMETIDPVLILKQTLSLFRTRFEKMGMDIRETPEAQNHPGRGLRIVIDFPVITRENNEVAP